jgi:hypothetical protein
MVVLRIRESYTGVRGGVWEAEDVLRVLMAGWWLFIS